MKLEEFAEKYLNIKLTGQQMRWIEAAARNKKLVWRSDRRSQWLELVDKDENEQ